MLKYALPRQFPRLIGPPKVAGVPWALSIFARQIRPFFLFINEMHKWLRSQNITVPHRKDYTNSNHLTGFGCDGETSLKPMPSADSMVNSGESAVEMSLVK